MKLMLRVEYVALFLFSIYLFSLLPFAWWWFLVLYLLPDIGMVGYLLTPQAGAFTYNVMHSLITGIVLYVAGYYFNATVTELVGVIIIGHAAFDRFLGYGLKYPDSFKHTHLGNLY
jgi:membrane-bound ClpP family serine protease